MTRPQPRRVRPRFPKGWHVPNNPKLWVTWEQADDKLSKEEVYWVVTSSKEGKPHSAPVWGIWKDSRFYFETGPKSVKAKNLSANPLLAFHVQDGLDTVILEGKAARLRKKGELDKLKEDYQGKYDYTPDWSDENRQVVFEATPSVAHAWRAPRMHRSLVNFVF
jgi:nitroimidazol reductase NimA-like FMN-containing flavoprotein (pyridoxamine 5'-phosphate oxidase superfamily)